jgi:Flp pilus assembly protein TadD
MNALRPSPILVASFLILTGAVVFLVHGLLNPRATLVEFLIQSKGLVTALGAVLSLFFAPTLFLFFINIKPASWLVRVAKHTTPAWLQRPANLSTVILSLSVALVVAGANIYSDETEFESKYRVLMQQIHQGVLDEASANLAHLKIEWGKIRYEKNKLDLAAIGVDVQRRWRLQDLRLDRWQQSIGELKAWLERKGSSGDFDAQALLARAYAAAGSQDTAIELLKSLDNSRLLPFQRGEAAIYLGEIYMKQGEFDSSLREFERVNEAILIDNKESKSMMLRKKGICQAQLRDWAGARRSFEQALALSVDKSILLSNVGFVIMLSGDYPTAISVLRQAEGIDEKDSVTQLNLAIAYTLDKQYDLARDVLKRALVRAKANGRDPRAQADVKLDFLIEAWLKLRQNPAYRTGVIEAIRRSDGLVPEPTVISQLAKSNEDSARIYLGAGEAVLRYQDLYGLEFIAADFFRQAQSVLHNQLLRDQALARIGKLPPSAQRAPMTTHAAIAATK